MNKRVHPLLDQSRRIPAMTVAQLRSALDAGVRVVDARSVDDFAAGHLRGSVNVGFDGRFAETGGMVAEVGEKIALVTYPGEEQDAALRLARIGSDNAIGYFTIDRGGAFPAELADLVRQAPRVSVAELDRLLAEDAVTLIDIRNPGERRTGCASRARSTFRWPSCGSGWTCLPTDKPIVVHCAGGWRSSVAASLLRAQGFEQVSDLAGGYNAWVDAHATVLNACSTSSLKGINNEHHQPDSGRLRVDHSSTIRLSWSTSGHRGAVHAAPSHPFSTARHSRTPTSCTPRSTPRPRLNSPPWSASSRSRRSWRSARVCWCTASPGPMPPAVLEDLIRQVKDLDMEQVRAKIAARKAAAAG